MEYAKRILIREQEQLNYILDNWISNDNETALKDRKQKLKSINKVLELIEQNEK